jgi:hypothetical protein
MLGDEWAKNTVYLHRIEPRFERAWIVHHARVVEAGRALSLLADPEYDPFDEVLLSSALDGSHSRPGQGLSDAERDPSTVEVLELAPERMRVLADLAAPGWLVVGEWHYPGWQARVDGDTQPIYRAHYGLRAVALDAGAHEIEFVYRPVTFYAGSFLSLIALVGAVVSLAIKPRTRGA